MSARRHHSQSRIDPIDLLPGQNLDPCHLLAFSGKIEHLSASRALDLVAFEVGGDLELQAADAGQKYELIDSPHDVADLVYLFLTPLLFCCLCVGLAQFDIFLQADRPCRDNAGGVRHCRIRFRVLLEGSSLRHIPQDFDPLRDRRMRARQVR